MTKDEALLLALEYLEASDNYLGSLDHSEPIAAIKEALAQPEHVQTTGETNVELDFYSDVTSNGQQRQLVGKVEMGQFVGDGSHKSDGNPNAEGAVAVIRGVDEYGPLLDWYRHWVNFPVGTAFYTTPPAAQRQWVGLDWLPEHKCGLHLSHNEHRDVYETIEQFYDAEDFISPDEWHKALAEDSVWVLHWYPETPIGFHCIAASTLEAIEAKLKEKNT